jgi:hypothetical protein
MELPRRRKEIVKSDTFGVRRSKARLPARNPAILRNNDEN